MKRLTIGIVLLSTACATTTVVESIEEPVLSVVGAPPALPPVPEAPPPPPPPPPKVELGEEAITLVEPILFGEKNAELDPASVPVMDELLALLKAHPELVKLSIEAHTDGEGSGWKNKKLSKKRAAAVRDALVAGGIEEDRLKVKGWGETKPLSDEDTDEAKAANRRIEVLILEREAVVAPAEEKKTETAEGGAS